jgi:sortase A
MLEPRPKRDSRHSVEVSLWATGLSLLAAYGAARAWSSYASHQGIVAMREARAVYVAESSERHDDMEIAIAAQTVEPRAFAPDMTTWSEARRAAYLNNVIDPRIPHAVLRIPSLRLEVPIYAGTSAAVLNRGAGLIEGTAMPGEDGNIGIAAHRDGFFRPLQDIRAGAELYIDTVQSTRRYRVTDVRVVPPQNVAVLANTSRPTVTLVTCYPFHFVGPAPQRFIVRAERAH